MSQIAVAVNEKAVIGNWQKSVIIHWAKGGGPLFSRGGAPAEEKYEQEMFPRAKFLWIGRLSGNIWTGFPRKASWIACVEIEFFFLLSFSSPLEASDLALEVGIEHKLRMKVGSYTTSYDIKHVSKVVDNCTMVSFVEERSLYSWWWNN